MLKKKVVFIASCPRSGSTLLEMMLAVNRSCHGIGEAFLLLDPLKNRSDELDTQKCACGELISECLFWSKAVAGIKGLPANAPLKAKYETLIRYAGSEKKNTDVIIDGSKLVRAMEMLNSIESVDLRVIYLIKDVRAWTVSQQDNYRRNGVTLKNLVKSEGIKGLYTYFLKSRMFNFHYWLFKNLKISRFVMKNQIPCLGIRYEELCLNTSDCLRKVCDFMGVDFEPQMQKLSSSSSHNIFGNRMRFQPEKMKKITYDFRWFYKNCWLLPSIIFPYVMEYNKKAYRSMMSRQWEK